MSEEKGSVKKPTLEDVLLMLSSVDDVLQMMIDREMEISDVIKVTSSIVVRYFQLLEEHSGLNDDPEFREQLIQYYENTVDASLAFLRDGEMPGDNMSLINGHERKKDAKKSLN